MKCIALVLLALLVVYCDGVLMSNFSIRESNNPYKKSSYFHGLAKKINMHPNLPWQAHFGHLENRDSYPPPALNKRQAYSSLAIDWRSTGQLASPEHQGACGSCWAFASVHTLMDNLRIRNQPSLHLSTQHVLECCASRACGGCSGASDNAAGFDFLSRKYTVESSCKNYAYYGDTTINFAYNQPGQWCSEYCKYPYSEVPASSFTKYNMTDFVRLDSDINQIKAALSSGPLLAAVQLFGDLYIYKSGIYRHFDGPKLGYHSVEMVGYGSEAGQDYWIIKNSWGQQWGENGYFRIAAGNNEAKVEDHVILPIFAGQKRNRGYDEAFLTPVGGSSEVNTEDPHVQDVAYFVANEIKPICNDGKLDDESAESIQMGETYQVKRVLQASSKIVGGVMYNVILKLSLPRCSKLMYVGAEIYLPAASEQYILQSYYYMPQVINKAVTLRALWFYIALSSLIGPSIIF